MWRLHSLILTLSFAALAPVAEPFRYPEARFGKGELRCVNGLPVLTVAGTPEEMGEQVGKLAALPAKRIDRKSTRLNSSHRCISYAVFCLKKKKKKNKKEHKRNIQ